VDYAAIRALYIELVKINHPDANGGDKESEERLKTINQALQTLKAAYLA
jgi:curved DNA-binding protein CbpA